MEYLLNVIKGEDMLEQLSKLQSSTILAIIIALPTLAAVTIAIKLLTPEQISDILDELSNE